jgi:hypothetical protein
LAAPRIAANRRHVGGGAVRQPRVDAGRGVKLRIRRAQDRGHGPAGRKARHIDAGRIDSELRHDGAGDAREDRRLAFVALLVGEIEPVPAGRQIGARRLLGIGDDEAALLGEPVHARADGEIVGVLRAAVEHDDQRKRAAFGAAWNIDLVVPRARRAGEASPEIGGALGRDDGRRLPQPRQWGGAATKARKFGLTQQFEDVSEPPPRTPGRASLRRGLARVGRVRALLRRFDRIRSPGDFGRGRQGRRALARLIDRRRGALQVGDGALDDPRRLHHILRPRELQGLKYGRSEFGVHCWILVH